MLTTRSDHIVAAEYRDLQTNAMAVDSQGKFALLASKRCIALVDLDDPEQRIGRISRASKWEVTSAMWNPHKSHAEYFVTATNQKVDLYRWCNYAELKQENSGTQFKAHTRVISDLDWSYTNPCYFATSSVDTYIFLWDIRDSRRPALSLSAVAGASQIKWNKVNGDVLATSHDGDLRIWDQRKGTTPVNYITAHLAKIHGVDWSPTSESKLATSSQDCTVKFWDLTNPKRAVDQLTTGSPVWRARYTPFGSGLITVVVPQLRRGENTLLLWNTESLQRPVHTFVGHSDVILEFQWRRLQRDDSDVYQLVTWSKDQSLRIWKIEPNLQEIVGRDFEDDDDEEEEEEGEEPLEEEEEEREDMGIGGGNEVDIHFHGFEPAAERERTATTDTRTSEYDIIEVEELKKLEKEEKERKDKETMVKRESQEGKIPLRDGTNDSNSSITLGKKQKYSESASNLPLQPRTLNQEFELLNKDIPNISVHDVNTLSRKCKISATVGDAGIDIDVEFPAQYPALRAPSFDVIKAKNLDSTDQTKIVQAMKDKSLKHVKKSQACLEPCIRQLRDSLGEVHFGVNQEEGDKSGSPTKEMMDRPTSREASLGPSFIPSSSSANPREFPYGLSPDVDASVPFPRTSGAKFCGSYLVVFQRVSKQSELTPRSLSALAAHASLRHSTQAQGTATQFQKSMYSLGRSPPSDMLAPYYHKPRKGSLRPRIKTKRGQVIERHSAGELKEGTIGQTSSGAQITNANMPHQATTHGLHSRQNDIPSVEIFDASCIFPFDRDLASKYIIDARDPTRMCAVNAATAAAAGRHDLAQLWNLAKQMASTIKQDGNRPWEDMAPWATHPYGFSLVDSVIRHLVAQSDVQTLSMISCAFQYLRADFKNLDSGCSSPCLSADGSTATYESAASTQLHSDSGPNNHFIRRTSSWCDMNFEVLRAPPEATVSADSCFETQTSLSSHPAPPNFELEFLKSCDKFKAVYSELLYRWQLLVKRCELLKCTSQMPSPHHGLELAPVCPRCDSFTGSRTVDMVPSTQSTTSKVKTSLSCTKCKKAKLTCAICRLSVKGLSTFCSSCAHGGHSIHMISWFKSHEVCPTGCGCRCLRLSSEDSKSSSVINSKDSSSSSLRKDEEELETVVTVMSPSGNLPWISWS